MVTRMRSSHSLEMPQTSAVLSHLMCWLLQGSWDGALCGWPLLLPGIMAKSTGAKASGTTFAALCCAPRNVAGDTAQGAPN